MKAQLAKAQALLNLKKPKTDEAMKLLQPIIKKKSAPWPAFHFSGIAFVQKGEYDMALSFLNEALNQGSDEPETYHAISLCYYNMGQYEEAEEYEEEALERNPDFFKGWLHLGSLYRAQAKLDEALKCFQRANQIDNSSAGVAYRIGEIYNDQGALDKALELYNITLKIDKDYLNAYLAKADVLKKQNKYREAEDAMYEVLTREPRNVAAKVSLAELHKHEGNYEKAIELYERLIEQYPKMAGARINYALCMQELGNFEESEKHYLQAFDDAPTQFESLSNYLMGLHYNPESTKEEIFEAHKLWDQNFAPKDRPARPLPYNTSTGKRLRVGFLSGGFRTHPVGWMITKALENLPKDQFEIYCYTTHNRYDRITKQIHEAADKWQSVIGYNDEVIANIIRDDEIDILVELSGHAADTRLRTVALEPAPVIVKWVGGLFNTTGMESVDYLLTDHQETPKGEEEFYTEKLVRMPDDYICFMPPEYAPDVSDLPAKENGYITFGCFNNPTKVNDSILEKWAEIMKEVPSSRLFLKSKQYDTQALRDRIIETMNRCGIDEERLIFEGQSKHNILLEKYNDVDIALDPWPYSGGLTTCEALWMGVPVVTKPGPTFAGRHSATHLHNAGFPEWITNSWEEYKANVVSLASDIDKLADIRKGIREQIAQSPVCDGARFGAHLSNAFREMWKQRIQGYEQNLPEGEWQDHIEIEALSDDQIQRKDAMEQVDEIEADFMKKQVKEIADRATTSANGNGHKNGAASKKDNTENFMISTKDGITISTPSDLNIMTPYVLLEQQQWYENEGGFIRDYLKTGMNVVDVGAGFGVYALPAAQKVGKKGHVYAFEPGAITKKHLEISKLKNGFENLDIIGKAVSAQPGKCAWKKGATPELNALNEDGTEDITTITLDSWWNFEGTPQIDLLKVDVNGSEAEILKGASELLEKESPLLMLSIAEKNLQEFADLLTDQGYTLYEYIPGPGILAEHDTQAGTDPYMQNVIAVKEDKAEDLKTAGWFHDEAVAPVEVAPDLWKEELAKQPWTESLMETWEGHQDSEGVKTYLTALNHVIAAEKLAPEKSVDPKAKSQKAVLLLSAAQGLIQLYNQGANSSSVVFTLVRALIGLGKRGQAVEILQKLAESTNMGQQNMNVDLPFMLPVKGQDAAPINTDLPKWLMVRTVEAWVILKDLSTYLSGPQEQKFLEVLAGNPEVMDELERIHLIRKVANQQKLNAKEKVAFEHLIKASEKQELSESVTERTGTPVMEQRIFERRFWTEAFNVAKAQKVTEIINKFTTPEFSAPVLEQVVSETEKRRAEADDDNVAFFIQTHALLALGDEFATDETLQKDLKTALTEKGWEHKSALYNHWFEKVEYHKEISDPTVSAIVISNRFKEKSVENLKRLSQQLEGRGEVIFVNNGIDDAEFAPLMEHVDTYVKAKGNSGAYLARNLGATFAKGEYLLFVDDDGIPDEGFVDGHLNIRKDREVIVSRGAYYSDDPTYDPWHYDLGEKEKPAITYLEGNALYNAAPFYTVNGWGDYILFGHGGMELSFRLLENDPDKEKQVYTPASRLNHNYFRGKKHQENKAEKQKRSYHLLSGKYTAMKETMADWPEVFSEELEVIPVYTRKGKSLQPEKKKSILHLHIGSQKTGSTAIQETLFHNRDLLKKQGFGYPGGEVKHHKLFFATDCTESELIWHFKWFNRQTLLKDVDRYFKNMEEEIANGPEEQIMSSEHLFIYDKKLIKNLVEYLEQYFTKVKVYAFVRNPIDYYRSYQQERIKARSYVKSPRHFKYEFKKVIEAWSEYCEVEVVNHSYQKDSSQAFSNAVGIDHAKLKKNTRRSNSSLSVEQMVLLEKIQKSFYADQDYSYKPHLAILRQINPDFVSKPALKEFVKPIIEAQHIQELNWLKEHYSIDFITGNVNTENYENCEGDESVFPEDKTTVRAVYEVDEDLSQKYEAMSLDIVLKKMTQLQRASKIG